MRKIRPFSFLHFSGSLCFRNVTHTHTTVVIIFHDIAKVTTQRPQPQPGVRVQLLLDSAVHRGLANEEEEFLFVWMTIHANMRNTVPSMKRQDTKGGLKAGREGGRLTQDGDKMLILRSWCQSGCFPYIKKKTMAFDFFSLAALI